MPAQARRLRCIRQLPRTEAERKPSLNTFVGDLNLGGIHAEFAGVQKQDSAQSDTPRHIVNSMRITDGREFSNKPGSLLRWHFVMGSG
jgi:hypothetical protein